MSSKDNPKKKKEQLRHIKQKNKKKKSDPWASFGQQRYILLYFFGSFSILFIPVTTSLDQRHCKGQTPNDKTQGGGMKCYLPHEKNVPYYPCPNGKLPDTALEGKKCPEEHVKGPDMFQMMLHFARSIFRDGYSILVGEAWIKADEQSKEAIAKLNNNNSNNNNNVKESATASTQKYERCSPVVANDIAMSVMEKTFNISANTVKKHNKKSMCCSQFTLSMSAEEQMKACSKSKENLFDYPPLVGLCLINLVGRIIIFDDPSIKETTAYNPNGTDDEAGINRWVERGLLKHNNVRGAQERSIWSNILSFFLPYLHEELESEVVSNRIDEFIQNLDDKILEMKTDKEKTKMKAKNLMRLNEIKTNFTNIRESFDKAWKKDNIMNKRSGKKLNGRNLLLQVLEGSWSKTKTLNYFNKGLTERGNDEEKQNIYLNFFIAATKPDDLRKWHGSSLLWNFIKGDYRYWFRYITTLYMPILTLLVFFVARLWINLNTILINK